MDPQYANTYVRHSPQSMFQCAPAGQIVFFPQTSVYMVGNCSFCGAGSVVQRAPTDFNSSLLFDPVHGTNSHTVPNLPSQEDLFGYPMVLDGLETHQTPTAGEDVAGVSETPVATGDHFHTTDSAQAGTFSTEEQPERSEHTEKTQAFESRVERLEEQLGDQMK